MPDQKILDQIIKAVREVIEPDKIILFGSQARGTASKESDYDILVINKDCKRSILNNLYMKMIEVNAAVDIILNTPEMVENSKNKVISVTKDALKEGITIYEN